LSFFWSKTAQNPEPEARRVWASGLGTEYDAFLYATVCADSNGTPLSVLSAMARMNLDPWIEAAALSKAPPAAATPRLAALIAAVPGGPPAPDAAATIALRLITLLPRQTRLTLPPLPTFKPLSGISAFLQSRTVVWTVLGVIALALATMVFGVHRPQSPPPRPTHVSAADLPPSGAVNRGRN
jgi:hypothetical protein